MICCMIQLNAIFLCKTALLVETESTQLYEQANQKARKRVETKSKEFHMKTKHLTDHGFVCVYVDGWFVDEFDMDFKSKNHFNNFLVDINLDSQNKK